ncbi:uncharacterized protein I206_105286 [Kwoniella pini CBS 10737]|uniref:Uncharacterized protein n=1 Tax=Kwoniella pini CBS 10737 TaxID=1296096 RepID=A0A1B9I4R5_9TREE|nr:uncharacterized protein I206_03805 [Kwoniella pini CBS 10737]OCF50481.1 hypothetical protein I206_03805 [Kwoniella pini CBS 10737]
MSEQVHESVNPSESDMRIDEQLRDNRESSWGAPRFVGTLHPGGSMEVDRDIEVDPEDDSRSSGRTLVHRPSSAMVAEIYHCRNTDKPGVYNVEKAFEYSVEPQSDNLICVGSTKGLTFHPSNRQFSRDQRSEDSAGIEHIALQIGADSDSKTVYLGLNGKYSLPASNSGLGENAVITRIGHTDYCHFEENINSAEGDEDLVQIIDTSLANEARHVDLITRYWKCQLGQLSSSTQRDARHTIKGSLKWYGESFTQGDEDLNIPNLPAHGTYGIRLEIKDYREIEFDIRRRGHSNFCDVTLKGRSPRGVHVFDEFTCEADGEPCESVYMTLKLDPVV